MIVRLSVALLLLIPALADAQQPWVDPALRLLLRTPEYAAFDPEVSREPAPGTPVDRVRAPGRLPLAVYHAPSGVPMVGLLVEVRSPAALAEIRRLGGEVGSVIGSVATVRLPVSTVPEILTLPSLVRVQAARPLTLHNDSAVSSSRVEEVRRRLGSEFLGATGRGVMVGVLDSGLDYTHPDFLGPDSVPRTVALWDQARQPTSATACTTAQLRARSCFTTDPNGHGTHVTGIAAGDGSAHGDDPELAFRYAGVATEADILAVKFPFGSGTDADLLDGIAWMFDVADSLGQPAVVNLSLGSQFGPHDGTSLFEAALDSLSGPGRIIVTSAGNDGNATNTNPRFVRLLIHGMGTPAPAQDVVLNFVVPQYTASSGEGNDFVWLEIWYDGAQDVTFEVTRPNGTSVSAATGDTISDSSAGGTILIIAPSEVYPGNGDRNAAIIVWDGEGSVPASGTWTLTVRSDQTPSKPLHAWIVATVFGGSAFARGTNGFDDQYVVSEPGNARELITVGAYVSRKCWPTPDANSQCLSNTFGFDQTLGDIAFFSSAGPTRDGRLKPEITAPGMAIMSTRSASVDPNPVLLGPSGQHRIELGTSMSSPHVAGAVALLLQRDPTLTPAQVRSILTSTAQTDAFTAVDWSDGSTGEPNEQWGYGKLDARAALETLVDPAVATDLWLSVRSDTLPLGAILDIRAFVANAFGDSLSAPAWSSSDPAVAVVDANGVVTPGSLGVVTVTATGGGFTETVFIEVVPPATLIVEATPLPDPGTATSRAGTRLPLLVLELTADGFEGILVDTLGFTLRGRDPGARFFLVRDLDEDGIIDGSDPVLIDTAVTLTGDSVVLALTPDLVVPAQDTVSLIAALRLSGAAPNGAVFQVVFRPDLTSSEGIRSGAPDLRDQPVAPVASAAASTTVLTAGETFTLSENPIRSDARRLILNFSETPTLAAVFTLRGVRVIDLLTILDPNGLRIEWPLTTDGGGVVAPGIYFLVVRVGDELIRRKLIVARSYGGGDDV